MWYNWVLAPGPIRLLRLDVLTIKNYYYSKGFLDVAIKENYEIQEIHNQNDVVNIFYEIVEGKQYYLNEIEINGNDLIGPKNISKLLGLRLDNPYNPVGLNDNLYLLENE